MISVIIAGAGLGKRIDNLPKAFIKIGRKELLYHSLDRFYKKTKSIAVVLPEKYIKKWRKELKKKYKDVHIIQGGKTRQDSVRAGLFSLKETDDIILVHDVARPFFSSDVLKRVIKGAEMYGACIPYIPFQDTVKETEGRFVKNTLNREKIVLVQTPQAFKSSILKFAYQKAYEENFYGSDDAVLVERAGFKVYLTRGNIENIKITYPADIETAKILLKKWGAKEKE
jgi:2-C-methyl-D-erythritol 4-phosphate cytidylyltransferase